MRYITASGAGRAYIDAMVNANLNAFATLVAWSQVAQLETLAFGTHYTELAVQAALWMLPALWIWRAIDSGPTLGVTA